LEPVLESFNRLLLDHDLVLVEGAGSPAEVNLRERDIANMGFAIRAGVPVCLLGDIERGGVIASLVGTQKILNPDDAAMIRGFAVNKFRGDPDLFVDGVKFIEQQTDWPCFGVIPWLAPTSRLPAEDAVSMVRTNGSREHGIRVVAPMLSRMANFDDADPLRLEPSVEFEFIPPGSPLPRDIDLVILFGTKSTIGDLRFLREQGWDHDIIAHARQGGRVLGICGGYQMLGNTVVDPVGSDGVPGEVQGLGLLNVETVMTYAKTVRPVIGRSSTSDAQVHGYEIHVGETTGSDCARPLLNLEGRAEGARSTDGRVCGTYVHGLLSSDTYRAEVMQWFGQTASNLNYADAVHEALDDLADGLEEALDIDGLFELAKSPQSL
ncbi:MAG: cobyric acid synthase, partial [Pseudomonadota bacterium]